MERKVTPKRNTQKKRNKSKQFDKMEVYRQLRMNIEYSSFHKDIQVVNITSSNSSEGKSTVASNLAMVSIAKYPKVLLIDCDLRKPMQHKIFKVSNKMGVSNLMKDVEGLDVDNETYFKKFKDQTSEGKLYVLSSGKAVPNPAELLSSEKFQQMIDVFRKTFDFIIIDCPPVNAVSDAIPVSRVADGTIFVTSARDTKKQDAKNALTFLKRNGANVLGCVLTKVDMQMRSYYNYYGNYE